MTHEEIIAKLARLAGEAAALEPDEKNVVVAGFALLVAKLTFADPEAEALFQERLRDNLAAMAAGALDRAMVEAAFKAPRHRNGLRP
jgi:hypothetical protein